MKIRFASLKDVPAIMTLGQAMMAGLRFNMLMNHLGFNCCGSNFAMTLKYVNNVKEPDANQQTNTQENNATSSNAINTTFETIQ